MDNQDNTVNIKNVPVGLVKGSGTMRQVRFKHPNSDTGYAGVVIKIDWVENALNLDYYNLNIPVDANLSMTYKSSGRNVDIPVSAEGFKQAFDASRSTQSSRASSESLLQTLKDIYDEYPF